MTRAADPKLLLVAYGAPDEPHAGSLFLRALCRRYPEGKLCRFAVFSKAEPGRVTDWEGIPVMEAMRPRETVGGRGMRALRRLTSLWVDWRIRRAQAPRLAAQAAAFGRAQEVEAVWAVLHRPSMIYMAAETARRLGVPLIVTVNDPPEAFAKDLRMHPRAARNMHAAFEACVRGCHGLGTASEPMRRTYLERFGRDSEVLILGPDDDERRAPGTWPNAGEPLRIGFAGSLYAKAEWMALLRALEEVDWRLAGRDVSICHVGKPPTLPTFAEPHVETKGWCTPDEATDHMAACHVTYLPYWFDPERGPSVRLCFPNKMTAYLAAGRPVFFHGPEESSPAEFLSRYPAGVCCHVLDTPAIRDALASLFADEATYARAVEAARRAMDEELNMAEFVRRFRRTVAGT
ncbi:MAG: glycosyltransferase [Planctomycetota bacterium]|nr:glycosyltransferase [Planctomycetota bacterium]